MVASLLIRTRRALSSSPSFRRWWPVIASLYGIGLREFGGLEIDWESARTAPPDALINSLAIGLPFDAAEKQALLEAYSLADRRDALIALLEIDAAGNGDDDDEPTSLQ